METQLEASSLNNCIINTLPKKNIPGPYKGLWIFYDEYLPWFMMLAWKLPQEQGGGFVLRGPITSEEIFVNLDEEL